MEAAKEKAMFGIIFKCFGIAIFIVMALYALANVLRNARRLDRRIAAFKAEQAELEEQGRTVHPYMALASLYEDEEDAGKTKTRKNKNAKRQQWRQ